LSLSLLLASINDKRAKIECAEGNFSYFQIHKDDPLNLFKAHETMRLGDQKTSESKVHKNFIPLMIEEEVVALVYIESEPGLSKSELAVMEIFLSQCASILENVRLYKQRDNDHQKAINTMADIAEFKDKDTAEHINRISYYTEIIALEMGLSKTTARAWGQASRLHDVGKMGIPDNILQKPDKLSDKEFDIMRTHTVIGASILGKISRMEVALL
jgi:response regulator RpfG family c-di-GMP phosphodiesterase